MSEHPTTATVGDLRAVMHTAYPPELAESWDAVGLICGDPAAPVRRVALALDCTEDVAQAAVANKADMLIVHHPLLLRGVNTVAADTPKGRIIHTLISNGVALLAAHTNADSARPGVNDQLATVLGVHPGRPISRNGDPDLPEEQATGLGRIGRLEQPLTLREFAQKVANRLPFTQWGIRVAGDPNALIRTVAVGSGAGDSFLDTIRELEGEDAVDCYLTSDLRHHPVDEYLRAGGPAIIDTAHWASEFPWCFQAAELLQRAFPQLAVEVLNIRTDPWTLGAQAAEDTAHVSAVDPTGWMEHARRAAVRTLDNSGPTTGAASPHNHG